MIEKIGLVLVYAVLNLLYFPIQKRPVKYYWELPIDKKIRLVGWMIVPYISYYIFLFGGILGMMWSSYFYPFIKAMIAAQVMGNLFWLLFPNGVVREPVKGKGVFRDWIRKLYEFDVEDGNGFPSAHVFHTVIVGYFLALHFSAWMFVVYTWSGLIVISTIFTKQHYILDIFGGLAVGALALLM